MKTIVISVSLLLLSTILVGQFTFAPLGAKWYFIEESCDPSNNTFFTYEYEVKEDSTILGKYCTKVRSGVCTGFPSCENEYFSYQEGDKVYLYDNLLNDFQMLYDFSLQAGESYQLAVCEQAWGVDSVTVMVNAVVPDLVEYQVVTITSNVPIWWSPIDAIIFKGIGTAGENPLLFPLECITVGEPCFITNITCYETPDAGVFQVYGDACAPSSTDESYKQPTINVFPNPTNGIVNLLMPDDSFPSSEWSLFDLTGS